MLPSSGTVISEATTSVWVGGQPSYSHRVVERIYVGVNAVVGYYRLQSFEAAGPVADYVATRRREGRLVGIGPTLARDSRDDSTYPRAGSLTAVTFTAYLPAWLSDYRFAELKADQRTFISLPLSSVLALQAFVKRFGGSMAESAAGDAIVGTPLYMAPEAISRPDTIDGRSDLYAVGAVAYFLLTGRHVFQGATVLEVCSKHMLETPVPPAQRLGKPLPADLEAIVLGCLEKDPEARPTSAAALRASLLACADAARIDLPAARAWWQARRASQKDSPGLSDDDDFRPATMVTVSRFGGRFPADQVP